MVISLLHPSRGRPHKALKTASEWIQKAECETDYILSVDLDDSFLDDYQITGLRGDIAGRSTKLKNSNKSVVEATNNAAKVATGNILVYLSDDFKCPDNWGNLILKEFEGVTEPMLLKVDDCLQKFDVPVLTIPIMNRALYEKLGYFWHPGYKSMFVDEDLYWTARKLNALKCASHLKFPHEHPANGKAENDETYKRSALNWDQGKAMFSQRKALGFPV